MTITLDTLAIGDVNYVSKHNSNYTIIKDAIDALQVGQSGAIGAVLNYPPFAQSLYGLATGRLSEAGVLGTDAGSAMLDISAGSVWIPTDATIRVNPSLATLDFTGQASNTYYTHITTSGIWSFDTTAVDAVHTIVFTSPSTFTSITQPVVVWGHTVNENAKISAALGGITYPELDSRLEAGEGGHTLIHPVVLDDPDDVTLTTAEGMEHAVFLLTGTLTANRELIVPLFEKPYAIINNTTGDFDVTVKTFAGSGVVVLQGAMTLCVCDGVDVLPEVIEGKSGNETVPYIISAWKNGLPGLNERVVAHSFPTLTGLSLAADAIGSSVEAETAATAETDFDLQKNDISIGTIRFAISGTVATFVGIGDETFVAGDRLEIIAPGSQDTTLAEVYFTLFLTRDAAQ